jgi:hypothetical protein
MTVGIRPTWALFDENGEHYGKGLYYAEDLAKADLWGRPDGVHMEPACQCLGPLREAWDCVVCSMIEEYGYGE